MPNFITHLCWNSEGWIKPTGECKYLEEGTGQSEYGFGFEEWNFSRDFIIDGLNYGYFEGISKSFENINGRTINLAFYTIDNKQQRLLVGRIRKARVLNKTEAFEVYRHFNSEGLIEKKKDDARAINGKYHFIQDKIDEEKYHHLFNLRFQWSDVLICKPYILLPETNRFYSSSRYQLHDYEDFVDFPFEEIQ